MIWTKVESYIFYLLISSLRREFTFGPNLAHYTQYLRKLGQGFHMGKENLRTRPKPIPPRPQLLTTVNALVLWLFHKNNIYIFFWTTFHKRILNPITTVLNIWLRLQSIKLSRQIWKVQNNTIIVEYEVLNN